MEALRAYTVAGAAAIFDPESGALRPSRRADFVVLSHDPHRWPLDRWAELRVEETYLGGERVALPDRAEAPPGRPYPASTQWHQPPA
jgi:predicted amidohydrolase YtcJ